MDARGARGTDARGTDARGSAGAGRRLRDQRYRAKLALRREAARLGAGAGAGAGALAAGALERMARARLCQGFPELAFEQRRLAGRRGCGAELWTSMEVEAGGRLVVVDVDVDAGAGLSLIHI